MSDFRPVRPTMRQIRQQLNLRTRERPDGLWYRWLEFQDARVIVPKYKHALAFLYSWALDMARDECELVRFLRDALFISWCFGNYSPDTPIALTPNTTVRGLFASPDRQWDFPNPARWAFGEYNHERIDEFSRDRSPERRLVTLMLERVPSFGSFAWEWAYRRDDSSEARANDALNWINGLLELIGTSTAVQEVLLPSGPKFPRPRPRKRKPSPQRAINDHIREALREAATIEKRRFNLQEPQKRSHLDRSLAAVLRTESLPRVYIAHYGQRKFYYPTWLLLTAQEILRKRLGWSPLASDYPSAFYRSHAAPASGRTDSQHTKETS